MKIVLLMRKIKSLQWYKDDAVEGVKSPQLESAKDAVELKGLASHLSKY